MPSGRWYLLEHAAKELLVGRKLQAPSQSPGGVTACKHFGSCKDRAVRQRPVAWRLQAIWPWHQPAPQSTILGQANCSCSEDPGTAGSFTGTEARLDPGSLWRRELASRLGKQLSQGTSSQPECHFSMTSLRLG